MTDRLVCEVISQQCWRALERRSSIVENNTANVVIDDNDKMRGLFANVEVKPLVAGLSVPVFEPTISTHDSDVSHVFSRT